MRAFLIVVLATIGLGGCETSAAPDSSLVGAWQLVKYVDTPDGGAPVEAFGPSPKGMFVFTADGRASVHIMRNPPRPDANVSDPDPDACVPEWYCSYFGSYTIDWSKQSWTIRVEGGNIPSFIGSDQTRRFTLEGDKLVLADSYEDGKGKRVRTERVLLRYRAKS